MDRMDSGGDAAGGPGGGFRGGPFPGGFGFSTESIFEQIFNQDPNFGGLGGMFGRLAIQPIRISFMEAIKGTKRRIR